MSGKVILHSGREKSLLRRHPWVFAGAVREHAGKPASGATVEVHAHDGRWLARAAWSPQSQIRARVWTFDETEVVDNTFFLRRLTLALQARQELAVRADLD